jgi:hypothetical protein
MNVVAQAKSVLPDTRHRAHRDEAGLRPNWPLIGALAANTAFWVALIAILRGS